MVQSSFLIQKEILDCLLLAAHLLSSSPSHEAEEGALKHLLIRYDLADHVLTSISTARSTDSQEERRRLERATAQLRLLRWFVERRMMDERRVPAVIERLAKVFGEAEWPTTGRMDGDEGEDESGERRQEPTSCFVDFLSALTSLLLALVWPDCDSRAGPRHSLPPPFLPAFFGLSSAFFPRAFRLFSLRFLGWAADLWPPLMRLISTLLFQVPAAAHPGSSVEEAPALDSHSLSAYPVAIAMLENKRQLMTLFIHASTQSALTASSSTLLTSLYRFCSLLFTRLGRDPDCFEVLDGLLDIPHEVDSEETHGSLLAAAVYRCFDRVTNRPETQLGDHHEVRDGKTTLHASRGMDGARPPPFSPLESATGSLLQTLVVVSASAKTAALYDLGLVDRVITDSLALEARLTLDSLHGAHDTHGAIPASDPTHRRLLMRLALLTNLLSGSAEARTEALDAADGGIGLLFHRLASWMEVEATIADALLRCLGAFSADHPAGVARVLCSGPRTSTEAPFKRPASRFSSSSSSSSRVASPPLGFPASGSSSLIHALTSFALRSTLNGGVGEGLRRKCFVLLGQLAALSSEVRGILVKTHFLDQGFGRLNPKLGSSAAAFPLHSAWLDFVCSLTTNVEGQAMVMKAPGAVDLLLEYLRLPLAPSSTNSSPTLASATASLRQKSALALHHLCFSPKNAVLLARPGFLPALIRGATPSVASKSGDADRKTALVCCAALWALASSGKKNAAAMKGSDCPQRLSQALYQLSRQSESDADRPLRDLHSMYCHKIISVLDS